MKRPTSCLHCDLCSTLTILIMRSLQSMIARPIVQANSWSRLPQKWNLQDPKASDHIGIGASNLLRREAYQSIGTYEKLRLEVVDDLKLGEAVKEAGLRQDIIFGPDMVRLRWAVGTAGVIRNL